MQVSKPRPLPRAGVYYYWARPITAAIAVTAVLVLALQETNSRVPRLMPAKAIYDLHDRPPDGRRGPTLTLDDCRVGVDVL